MILTVLDLKRAIAQLPDALPVRIQCAKDYLQCDESSDYTETDFADGVEFQGNHVLITCPE